MADEPNGGIRVGQQWSDRLGQRGRIAAAGYGVVAIFAIATAIASVTGLSITNSAAVGVIAAAPLLIAFIGDRITTIKGFGVEVSLSQVTVDVAGDNSAVAPDLSDAVMPSQEPEGSPFPAPCIPYEWGLSR